MHPTWTFERGSERIVLERRTEPELALVILSGDSARHIPFADLSALIVFEADMQEFLVRTGWSLADFAPERRGQRDRRTFPRRDNDRRRWWSDPIPALPAPRNSDTPSRQKK